MPPEKKLSRQDLRVWCIEQLIRYEGLLDNRMYECADHAASVLNVETKETLYTLWTDWKRRNPTPSYHQINRM